MKEYRYELKFIISKQMGYFLKNDLSKIMDLDRNSISRDKSYFIRSLYFDDLSHTAFFDKVDGVEFRTKYRIRIYNHDHSFIRLECKQKAAAMTCKESYTLSRELAEKIITDDIYELPLSTDNLLSRFLVDKRRMFLVPAVIVDYDRVAFTYPLSDVRITFDENIKTGVYNYDLFDENMSTFPIIDHYRSVVEVKFNEYLPESLMIMMDTIPLFRIAISKFAFSCMAK